MKKVNKITFFGIGIAVLFALCITAGVYAASNNKGIFKLNSRQEAFNNNVKVGEIEKISGRTLTITLGEMEKSSDSSDFSTDKQRPTFSDFNSEDRETATPTAFDLEDEDFSTPPDFDSEDGEFPMQFDSNSKGQFVKGTETITVTVPDDIDISNLKTGDVIRFEMNDNNEITKLFSGEKSGMTGNKNGSGTNRKSRNNIDKGSSSNTDTVTGATKTQDA